MFIHCFELVENLEERKDCPCRHENGNCLAIGSFCLAVPDTVCHETNMSRMEHSDSKLRKNLP